MRFLFCPWSSPGETFPLLAVAEALIASGHDVEFAAGGPASAFVKDRGLRCHPLTGPAPARDDRSAVWRFLLDPLADEIRALDRALEAFSPDVVVDGALPFGPRLIAEKAGLPRASIPAFAGPVTQPAGPCPAARADELAAWNGHRRRLGLTETTIHPWLDVPSDDLVLLPTAPALDRRPHAPHAHMVGALVAARVGRDLLPPFVTDADDRRLVFASQGTIHHETFALLRLVLAGLAGAPVRVLATTARTPQPGELGAVPDNARIFPLLPVTAVLSQTDVVVTHAGPGTVNDALLAGVPMILIPLAADQPVVAGQVAAAGAGIRLDLTSARPEDLAAAVDQILHRPAFAGNARRLGRSLTELGGAPAAARLLNRLAHEGGPLLREPTTAVTSA